MEIGIYLARTTQELMDAGIETARLDCLILLEDVIGVNRASLLAHPEMELSDAQLTLLNTYSTQRKTHLPLAYIRGKVAFYGREFVVTPAVLVPRPETEIIIDMLKEIPFSKPPRIADVGTGSGCIGITAALEIPHSDVLLFDIDSAALAVAKTNMQRHNAVVRLQKNNLLADVAEPFNVILANLPYVPVGHSINTAASFEPSLALFSGTDGLDHYRTFWKQIGTMGSKPQHVITEAFPSQHTALTALAAQAGYTQQKSEGFVQHFALLD